MNKKILKILINSDIEGIFILLILYLQHSPSSW